MHKIAQKGCKEKGRNTKGTPKEHQRIWLETSEILRQGVEAAICVKPLSQVDPKDLKLLGVGALVVPLLQPASHVMHKYGVMMSNDVQCAVCMDHTCNGM